MHYSFLRLAHDQVFEAWLETAFAKEIDETFPRVTDWRARMVTHMRGAVSDAEDVTCALMNLHLTSHCFTKLAPLMPKRYRALVRLFAGGEEEDGDDDDDDGAGVGLASRRRHHPVLFVNSTLVVVSTEDFRGWP